MNITRCIIKNNQITSISGGGVGGGDYIYQRIQTQSYVKTSFISNSANNNQGHEIFTKSNSDGTPTISIINSYFNNPTKSNIFYNYDDGNQGHEANWSDCSSSSSLCTEHPFTGTCNQVSNTNTKFGVSCLAKGINCIDTDTYYYSYFTNIRRSSRASANR